MRNIYKYCILLLTVCWMISCAETPDITGEIINGNAPHVITIGAIDSTSSTLTIRGIVSKSNGSKVFNRGVCLDITQNVDTTKHTIHATIQSDTTFIVTFEGLTRNTTYYVKAFAENDFGLSYGELKTAKTIEGFSKLETKDADPDSIKATAVLLEGVVLDQGEKELIERGFLIYDQAPTEGVEPDTIKADTKDDNFSAWLTGLQPSTSYYFKAYAKSVDGMGAGALKQVTTTSGKGEITTRKTTNIRISSAISGGGITKAGEGTIIEQGVYLTTDKDFNLDIEKIQGAQPFSDEFTCNLTGLTANTTYYVKAYAINSFDSFTAGYEGQVESFTTTTGLPIVSIDTDITLNKIYINAKGNVVDGGESAVIKRGFVWSSSKDFINNDSLSFGNGNGAFTGKITGFASNSKYYLRAFAENLFGVSYSEAVEFETEDLLKTDVINSSGITKGTVAVSGSILDNSILPAIGSGICWSTDPVPTINKGVVNATPDAGGHISAIATEIKGESQCYFRIFVETADGLIYGNTVSTFTPEIFRTTTLAAFPGERPTPRSSSYFAINNDFYLLGGDASNYFDNLWDYNVTDNTWTERLKFPLGKYKWQTCIPVSNGVYVFGGLDKDNTLSDKLYFYHKNNNTWQQLSAGGGPSGRYSAIGFFYDNKLYFTGGITANDIQTMEVWCYDLNTNTWAQKNPIMYSQVGGYSVTINNTPYICFNDNQYSSIQIWSYDQNADKFEPEVSLPNNNSIFGAVVYNDNIWIADHSTIWMYDIDKKTWTKKSQFPLEYEGNIHGIYIYDDLIYIGLGKLSANKFIIYDPSWDN